MLVSDKPQMTMQYRSCALRLEKLRLQTHSQNKQYLSLFHCINGFANASRYYVYTHIGCLLYIKLYTFPQKWAK